MENESTTVGRTDEKGHYVIQYNSKVNGAFPGKNVVRINIGKSFDDDPDEDDEGDGGGQRKANLLAKYNIRTTLSADVKEEGSPYDFELSSK